MHHIWSRFALIALACSLAASACASVQAFPLERVQVANVKVLPGAEGFQNPLTGIVSYTPQEWQNRPALAIKVGNSGNERPQAGIDDADLVFEELVEGGVTRFVAVFLTEAPERIGPVRSVRTVDPDLLAPLRALFGYSGGVPEIVGKVQSSQWVTDVSANRASSAYRRDPNRSAPYNYYTSAPSLWSGREGEPPEPQFDFLASDEDITEGGTSAAAEMNFSFGDGGSAISYDYDEQTGKYLRTQGSTEHVVEGPDDGTRLAFTNILVQMVDVTSGSTVDQAGNRTKEIEVIGEGGAMLVRGGRAFQGRWTRSSVEQPPRFTTPDGEPLELAPGNTIVELLPSGRDVFVS